MTNGGSLVIYLSSISHEKVLTVFKFREDRDCVETQKITRRLTATPRSKGNEVYVYYDLNKPRRL
jgi:hypothetical protein